MSVFEQRIKEVKTWELRRGKAELLRHFEGSKELTRAEAMLAKCYDCMGGYPAGEFEDSKDCKVDLCPLYPWMPYKKGGARKRVLTESQKMTLGKTRGKVTDDEAQNS